MRWPPEAQSRGWLPPLRRSACSITLRAHHDVPTRPSSRPRGHAPSRLRNRRPTPWQPPPETDSRPPAVGAETATGTCALDISPFKRRRESNPASPICKWRESWRFQRRAFRAVSLYVASRRFSYRKVREVPEWGRCVRGDGDGGRSRTRGPEFSRKIAQLGLANSTATTPRHTPPALMGSQRRPAPPAAQALGSCRPGRCN
jgi:hypothetical protein